MISSRSRCFVARTYGIIKTGTAARALKSRSRAESHSSPALGVGWIYPRPLQKSRTKLRQSHPGESARIGCIAPTHFHSEKNSSQRKPSFTVARSGRARRKISDARFPRRAAKDQPGDFFGATNDGLRQMRRGWRAEITSSQGDEIACPHSCS